MSPGPPGARSVDDRGGQARAELGQRSRRIGRGLRDLRLASWVTSGLWRHVDALALVNRGSDVPFFEWTLVHAARIFTHGENPLFAPR